MTLVKPAAQFLEKAGVPNAPLQQPAVLSVEKSVLGKRWSFAQTDDRLAAGIAQAHDLPEMVSRILVSRGVGFEGVEEFLNPTLKAQLPDPSTLQDMDKAAERIASAIMTGEKVAVFGDYDVDGATSSALLKRFFRAQGRDITVYIPDRITEGYGPNAPALLRLQSEGIRLLLTVDCGITAFEPLAIGAAAGLDIIVLDHHRAEPQLPPVHAVVNPNRLDDTSGQGHMAAVGVTFLTIVAVNRLLRNHGWYNEQRPEPRILQWLDIVALGTVCDIVPLTGVNRAFVSQGLRVMGMRLNPGLAALADLAAVSEPPNAFHAGFVFGPRVNAGGRVGEANLGWRLLATEDTLEARVLAKKLHEYNAERKNIEEDVIEGAVAYVEEKITDDLVIVASGDGWHPGVIGIVAARIKEKYNRPTCIVSFDDRDIGKASARSVTGIDLGASIIAAKEAGLLIAGGGHKMAAGFTVARAKFAELCTFLNDHARNQLQGNTLNPELKLDSVLSTPALSIDLVEKLQLLAPFGAGHSEPRFALTGVKVVRATVVGERHVSCYIQDTAGGTSIKAIAFRAMDTELGPLLLKGGNAPMHLAGHATINTWQGKRSVNFQIVDACPVYGAS
ncbi:MAG TPA: single-stranded-DNA-specific exonuclease RecJ [Patescibacteria group bacterium]|nr:single-stranded-DNA-specific exonuclease RecJ [Patescibacteria group bacterium]